MRGKPQCFSEEGASSSCWWLSSGWGTQTGGPSMHPPGLAMHSSGAAVTTIAQPDSKVFITSYSLGREHLQPLIKSPSCHKPHFCMCKMPPNCPFFCLFLCVDVPNLLSNTKSSLLFAQVTGKKKKKRDPLQMGNWI